MEEAFGPLHEVTTGAVTVLAEFPAAGGILRVVFVPYEDDDTSAS